MLLGLTLAAALAPTIVEHATSAVAAQPAIASPAPQPARSVAVPQEPSAEVVRTREGGERATARPHDSRRPSSGAERERALEPVAREHGATAAEQRETQRHAERESAPGGARAEAGGARAEPGAPQPFARREAARSTPSHEGAALALSRARTVAVREPGLAERSLASAPSASARAASLDPEAVRRVLRGEQHRLRQCYVTAMRRHGLPADVTMRMTIGIDVEGYVSDIAVEGPDFGGITRCLRRTALRWRFPASREGGRVPIPLAFRAVE